jgi:hypothetical protein
LPICIPLQLSGTFVAHRVLKSFATFVHATTPNPNGFFYMWLLGLDLEPLMVLFVFVDRRVQLWT